MFPLASQVTESSFTTVQFLLKSREPSGGITLVLETEERDSDLEFA